MIYIVIQKLGNHKTSKTYGSAIFKVHKEEVYKNILLKYVELLRTTVPNCTDNQVLFCKEDGKRLDCLSSVIKAVSKKVG